MKQHNAETIQFTDTGGDRQMTPIDAIVQQRVLGAYERARVRQGYSYQQPASDSYRWGEQMANGTIRISLENYRGPLAVYNWNGRRVRRYTAAEIALMEM